MTIWILAIVLLAITAALGYTRGAIRMVLSLIGLIVAAFLAIPLAPAVTWAFPYIRLGSCQRCGGGH